MTDGLTCRLDIQAGRTRFQSGWAADRLMKSAKQKSPVVSSEREARIAATHQRICPAFADLP
jgi:hypothetical protein